MDIVYYDDNIVSDRDREAILGPFQEPYQIQETYQIPDQGSSLGRAEGSFSEVNNQDNGPQSINPTIFSLSYYQQYFNVNTEDVYGRIKGSLLPSLKANYYEEQIKSRPDLYGPVWVCLTLAFSIAIGSNLLDYFTTSAAEWRYGFHIITKALFIVFVYSWIIPVILWSMMKWYLSSQANLSALELISTYGYALVVYIPLSICWIIHVPYFQWILLLLGATSSGIVLISTMQPMVIREDFSIIAAIVVLHIFFSLIIFFYFFHVN